MNAIALVVALAALSGDDDPVNYLVETTTDKQQQYTLQIKKEILPLVANGEEIHSDVPLEAAQVQRLCLRIGMTKPARTATGEAAFRSLLVSASRWAMADRRVTPADEPPSILWTARADPQPIYGLRYGYQPDAEGRLAYFVQLDPAVLRTLQPGDEIYAPIDPAAGRPDKFIVSITKKDQPPRVAPTQALAPVTPLAAPPPQTQFQPLAQSQFNPGGQTALTPLDGGARSQFPSAAPGGGFNPNTTVPGNAALPPLRTNEFQPQQSVETPPAPGGFSHSGEYGRQLPRSNSSATVPPPTAPPLIDNRNIGPVPGGAFSPGPGSYGAAPPLQVADARGFGGGTGANYGTGGTNAAYGTGGSYGGGTANYAPAANTGFGAPPDNRLASAPPQPAASLSPVTPAGSLTTVSPPVAALPPQKESWGIFVVVLFALFFSIGGNLYLAWTALEFHNRYRSAIDRLRSAARNS